MAIGYVIPLACTAIRTLSTSSSKLNSGVCTPMTTNPWSLYRVAHAPTYGNVRSQLMQVYVQKSTSTTLRCRSVAVSGGELSQAVAPPSEARSLALNGLNGFTVSICITESLVPIHAAPRESAAIPKKRRRSGRRCANICLCLCNESEVHSLIHTENDLSALVRPSGEHFVRDSGVGKRQHIARVRRQFASLDEGGKLFEAFG